VRKIIYEQPLNERMRSFLRLEYLFRQVDYSLNGTSLWNSRAALEGVIEIHNLVGRSDLKTEILKELERHTQNLTQLMENPQVDHQRLDHILLALDSLNQQIFSDNQPFGFELKQNELINTIRQRITVPGGTCEMDLPVYHFWLQQTAEKRIEDLNEWMSGFSMLRQAIDLVLRLIRESAVAREQMAEEGFYQRNMDASNPCQLLRIGLSADCPYYPEISAGKHRFTIRIMQQNDHYERPKQISDNVAFDLYCCII